MEFKNSFGFLGGLARNLSLEKSVSPILPERVRAGNLTRKCKDADREKFSGTWANYRTGGRSRQRESGYRVQGTGNRVQGAGGRGKRTRADIFSVTCDLPPG